MNIKCTLPICLLLCLVLSACGSGEVLEPTQTSTATATPAPTATATLTPTDTPTPPPSLTPTPNLPSTRSDAWRLQLINATWSEASVQLNMRALPGNKFIVLTIRLEYLGADADIPSPSLSMSNGSGVKFVVAQVSGPFPYSGWIVGPIMMKKTETIHLVKGEIIDGLVLGFSGPENSKEFVLSFADLPPFDITEYIETE